MRGEQCRHHPVRRHQQCGARHGLVRRSLGEEEVSYFGWSYGAELGGTWATLFPSTVRAAVFDSAPDRTPTSWRRVAPGRGFEQALSTFLAQCSADPSCAFHNDGDAEGAFDELMLELDVNPIPSIEGRPEITLGVALTAVAQAMYGDRLARAIQGSQFCPAWQRIRLAEAVR